MTFGWGIFGKVILPNKIIMRNVNLGNERSEEPVKYAELRHTQGSSLMVAFEQLHSGLMIVPVKVVVKFSDE